MCSASVTCTATYGSEVTRQDVLCDVCVVSLQEHSQCWSCRIETPNTNTSGVASREADSSNDNRDLATHNPRNELHRAQASMSPNAEMLVTGSHPLVD